MASRRRFAAARCRWFWLGVLVSLAAAHTRAAAQPLDEASESEVQAARASFQAGKSAFEQAHYDEALRQFSAADQAVASPNAKLMVARCLARLDRPAEAYTLLGSLIDEAQAYADGRYDQAAEAAVQEQRALEPRIALLTVQVTDPTGDARLVVAGRDVPRAAWTEPIAVDPGAFEVALISGQVQGDGEKLALRAGSTATLELAVAAPATTSAVPVQAAAAGAAAPELRERDPAVSADSGASTSSPSLRTWGYVSGAAGVASLAAFALFGALSNSAFTELEQGCPDPSACAPGLRDTAERGRTYQTLANVSLGLGVAALGAGAVLWVVGAPDDGVEVAVGTSGVRIRGAL